MPEKISVIICTKDRAADIVRAVRSLLQDRSPDVEIIVVDQSDDDATLLALEAFRDDRLRYHRSQTQGKGGALNEGLKISRSPFVACTDDDCEASAGWMGRVVRPMIEHPQVALVFSRVDAPDYDHDLGYIPDFIPDRDRLLTRPRALLQGWGLGAGMAFRRDVVLEMGGVDPRFGPGGRFPSADDFDLELRLLLKGSHVYESCDVGVTHYGFRTRAEGRAHTVRDWYALGASCAKAVRGGHPVALALAGKLLWERAVWPSLQAAVHRRRPPLRRVTAFASGFVAGLMIPVDRRQLVYTAPRQSTNTVDPAASPDQPLGRETQSPPSGDS